MRFYRWLVRKLCEILGNYCWLVRKWYEIIDNYSWLVRKLREILDNYSWWALFGGRLPRPHFLDLDRVPGMVISYYNLLSKVTWNPFW